MSQRTGENNLNKILCGDWIEIAKTLPDGCVHCVITSPPYWSQRDYGVVGQLGLEKTFSEHIEKLVDGFRELRRILRDDGILWLNYGDKYGGSGMGLSYSGFTRGDNAIDNRPLDMRPAVGHNRGKMDSQLLGLAWRLALALQADGWILRSDVIWAKAISFNDKYSGSTMPESMNGTRWERCRVKIKNRKILPRDECYNTRPTSINEQWLAQWSDCPGCPKCEPNGGYVLRRGSWRCTRAHEYLFQFVKQIPYYCDMEAVREETVTDLPFAEDMPRGGWGDGKNIDSHVHRKTRPAIPASGRNLRDVWTINPQPYPDAHYACVDEDTECLTTDGWRTIAKLPKTGTIPIVAFTGKRLHWELATIHEYSYDGLLVGAECRYLSMVITPNHRVWTRHYRSTNWRIVEAEALKCSHVIRTSAPFVINANEDYKLPTSLVAELAGWVLTDGGYNQGRTITIYQTKEKGKKRIEYILKKLGIEAKKKCRLRNPKETEWTFTGFWARWMRQTFPVKEGRYGILFDWCDEDLTALWDGMVGGDGNCRQDGRITFVGSKWKVDFFQALSLRLGKTCRITHRQDNSWAAFISNRNASSLRGTNGQGRILGKRHYQGIVWCPSVPSGMWLARRNGKPFISGNTFPEDLIEPCIKVSTSQKGCCPACGAAWARVIESRQIKRKRPEETSITKPCNNRRPSGNAVAGIKTITLSWRPTCSCHVGDPVPCVVYDPFMGSGTVAAVAARLGRNYCGSEISPDYLELQAKPRILAAETGLDKQEIKQGQQALFENKE